MVCLFDKPIFVLKTSEALQTPLSAAQMTR